MKRVILPGGVIVLIISLALGCYAKMEKTAISVGNLADLKGKWVGSRTVRMNTLNTDLEISNDSLPVQGKVIFYQVGRPGVTSMRQIFNFKDGEVNDKGNLLITSSPVELELSLYKDAGKMKLEGDFTSMGGVRGTMSFEKK
jgi:hypothetical protein